MTLRSSASRGVNGWLLVPGVFCWVGCAHTGVEIQRLGDNTTLLKCPYDLNTCIDTIDTVCKGSSYEILYARDDQRVMGDNDESMIENRSSIAAVHCVDNLHKARGPEGAATYKLPAAFGMKAANSAAPASATPASATSVKAAAALSTPAHACVPGTTQACVGSAACSGGQACLPDGSGFGACDCGGAKTPASTE